jgi:hypothetical protein
MECMEIWLYCVGFISARQSRALLFSSDEFGGAKNRNEGVCLSIWKCILKVKKRKKERIYVLSCVNDNELCEEKL